MTSARVPTLYSFASFHAPPPRCVFIEIEMEAAVIASVNRPVLVFDFGSQYVQLIAPGTRATCLRSDRAA